MTTNTATTKEQSARLLQCGVSADTADMCWFRGWGNVGDYDLNLKPYNMLTRINVECCRGRNEIVPAWSLSALLGLLPKEIKVDESPYDEVQEYGLLIYPFMGGWQVDYQYCDNDECQCLKCVHATDLVEACVKAIEWLAEDGYKLNDCPCREKGGENE